MIYADAEGYYRYLPATFIQHNLDSIQNLPTNIGIADNYISDAQGLRTETTPSPLGHFIIIYTSGVAILQAPFFAVAHAYEKLCHLPANGWSSTYENAIKFSNIFYVLLGLLFVFKNVNYFFGSQIAKLTTLLIFMCTNLFWFTMFQAGMSHTYLFALIALIIWFTIKAHDSCSLKYFMLLAFCLGLVFVMRPSDALCIIIPFFYNVNNKQSIQNKLIFIQQSAIKILIASLFFIIPIIPQLMYWKKYTGSFIYNSYVGNSFFWDKPQIIKGVLDANNGWLIYTPVMLLALVALFFYKKAKPFLLVTLIYLPLYMYVIYSWWCFQYINGFGSRPMIHLYPLLAFGIATMLHQFLNKNFLLKSFLFVFIALCCIYNIALSRQQARGTLISESSTNLFNLKTMFHNSLNYADLLLLDIAEKQPQKINIAKQVIAFIATDSTKEIINKQKKAYHLFPASNEFGDTSLQIIYNDTVLPNTQFIKFSGMFSNVQPYWSPYKFHLIVVEILRNGKPVLWRSVKINNKIGTNKYKCLQHYPIQVTHCDVNTWDEINFFLPTKNLLQNGDEIKTYIWNCGRLPLKIQSMSLSYCN